MENANSQPENNSNNNIKEEDKKIPKEKMIQSERKKIMSNIVKKSIQCSKTTIELTSKLLDSIMSQDKQKIISLCKDGLPDDLPELRSLVWKINFGYLPLNMEEWDNIFSSQRIAYQKYKSSVFEKLEKELELFDGYQNMTKEEKKALDKKTHKPILEEICKDTNRTHTEMSFFFRPGYI